MLLSNQLRPLNTLTETVPVVQVSTHRVLKDNLRFSPILLTCPPLLLCSSPLVPLRSPVGSTSPPTSSLC